MPIRLTQVAGSALRYHPGSVRLPAGTVSVSTSFPDEPACNRHL